MIRRLLGLTPKPEPPAIEVVDDVNVDQVRSAAASVEARLSIVTGRLAMERDLREHRQPRRRANGH